MGTPGAVVGGKGGLEGGLVLVCRIGFPWGFVEVWRRGARGRLCCAWREAACRGPLQENRGMAGRCSNGRRGRWVGSHQLSCAGLRSRAQAINCMPVVPCAEQPLPPRECTQGVLPSLVQRQPCARGRFVPKVYSQKKQIVSTLTTICWTAPTRASTEQTKQNHCRALSQKMWRAEGLNWRIHMLMG